MAALIYSRVLPFATPGGVPDGTPFIDRWEFLGAVVVDKAVADPRGLVFAISFFVGRASPVCFVDVSYRVLPYRGLGHEGGYFFRSQVYSLFFWVYACAFYVARRFGRRYKGLY